MAELTSGVAGLDNYVKLFSDNRPLRDTSKVRVSSDYYSKVIDDERVYSSFATLNGDEDIIDTSLEWVLATYYSPALVSIRPPDAEKLLPANSKESALKLALATYKELVEVKFLDPNNTAAIGRYEGVLKFISDKSGVTRAEIDAYYRAGIESLIAEAVEEQFNKISFVLSVPNKGSYSTVLARNPKNNQYTLSYERPSVENDDKEISGTSLNALLSALDRSPDFDQNSAKEVSKKAALIPGVVYDNWKTQDGSNGTDALALIKETLTNFYASPSRSAYELILNIQARYLLNGGLIIFSFGYGVMDSFSSSLQELSPELYAKVNKDTNANDRNALNNQVKLSADDSRYNVFSTRF
jgi:hypothetical protein